MPDPMNPQHEQMTHESMLRTLAYQAEAIWPQESLLFDRYQLPEHPNILDLACGTGEGTRRLAERYPGANILGIDLEESLLALARTQAGSFGERISFETGNAYMLNAADQSYDLTVCRHLLQIVPDPHKIVREIIRVTRPGGWIHLLSEDYGMIFFHPTRLDNTRFWHEGPVLLGAATNTNMKVGRSTYTMVAEAGLVDIAVDYVVVDTLRIPRDTFIAIWEAWKDGYTDVIAQHTDFSREEVADHWADMLECLKNPHGYAAWHIPIISARRPEHTI